MNEQERKIIEENKAKKAERRKPFLELAMVIRAADGWSAEDIADVMEDLFDYLNERSKA